MRRLLPSPALSLALFVLWLLLMQSLERRDVVLGVVLALFWPAVTARFAGARSGRASRSSWRWPCSRGSSATCCGRTSQVAWAVLTRRSRDIRSGFVRIPLELTDPNGLAILAMIVTFTPGTAWAQLSADKRVLLLHVLVPSMTRRASWRSSSVATSARCGRSSNEPPAVLGAAVRPRLPDRWR